MSFLTEHCITFCLVLEMSHKDDLASGASEIAYFKILPAITLRNLPKHRFYPICRGSSIGIPIDCFMAYLGKDIDLPDESKAQEIIEKWIQLCKRNRLATMRLKHHFTRKQISLLNADLHNKCPIIFVYVRAFDIKQFLLYVGRSNSRMYNYLCDTHCEKAKDTYLDITPYHETTQFIYHDAMMVDDRDINISNNNEEHEVEYIAKQQSRFTYILKNKDAMMTFDDDNNNYSNSIISVM
jgi:hypothetical protein